MTTFNVEFHNCVFHFKEKDEGIVLSSFFDCSSQEDKKSETFSGGFSYSTQEKKSPTFGGGFGDPFSNKKSPTSGGGFGESFSTKSQTEKSPTFGSFASSNKDDFGFRGGFGFPALEEKEKSIVLEEPTFPFEKPKNTRKFVKDRSRTDEVYVFPVIRDRFKYVGKTGVYKGKIHHWVERDDERSRYRRRP